MIRIFTALSFLLTPAFAQELTRGYFAVSEGGDRDPAVIEFVEARDRDYFENRFLAEAPHTKTLVSSATAIKCHWHLVGYLDGKAIYDLFHTVEAHGGEWVIKTILMEFEESMYRPLFCRRTQPDQWPVHKTFFSISEGEFLLVDRYRENARIPGPYGHVIRRTDSSWVVEDFIKHPLLFGVTKPEHAGTGQTATRAESQSEDGRKPQPESEGRSR